jgi:hypothetical protein
VFDAPTRETCVVRRPRTNTPLQALVLLNDDTYVEAARSLAARSLETAGVKPGKRASGMFRRAAARAPGAEELAALVQLYERQRQRFAADVAAADKLMHVGISKRGHHLNPVELAAWTVVAQAILNLDEIITRR